MHQLTAIPVVRGRQLGLLSLVVMSCGVFGHAVDANRPAAVDATRPAPVDAKRPAAVASGLPTGCAATGQRPGRPDKGTPAMIDPAAYPGPYSYVPRDATIRLLAKSPLTYQVIDPGTRAAPRQNLLTSDWLEAPGATAQAAAALDHVAFGDIVRARFLAAEGVFNATPPPTVLASVWRGAPLAADPPLIAQWRTDQGSVVSVYADGHAFVAQRGDLVDVTLSATELDDLLHAFATAGFDGLPAGEPAQGNAVILACARYQQVEVASHERVLAPVLAAFARIADRGIAMARPLLRVEPRGWHPEVVAWPADAPPVSSLYGLRLHTLELPTAVDASSPLFRPLPDELVAAFPAARPWPVVVRDRGELWELFELGCDRCRPGTYSTIHEQHATFQEAPPWLPDLASVGPEGHFLDGVSETELGRVSSGAFRQRGEVYMLRVTRAIPPAR
ncbi:MAG: hypothetical protein K8W52_32630 [Deltaproteobacteria bacterium]|nr:hypothetical protein [Deltaproteobacteria bacterium]